MFRHYKRWWLQGAYRHALHLLHRRVLERYLDELDLRRAPMMASLARRPLSAFLNRVEHYKLRLIMEDMAIPPDCEVLQRKIARLTHDGIG